MKRKIIIAGLLLLGFNTNAQINHYISCDFHIWGDFYNKEKDKIRISQSFRTPLPSYILEYKNLRMELFVNLQYHLYHKLTMQDAKAGDRTHLFSTNYGFNFQYSLFENNWVKISPTIGLIRNEFYSVILLGWNEISPGVGEEISIGEEEKQFGFTSGLNINIPLFKRLFINSNIRYNILPNAKFNKRNLVNSIGIGYRFGKDKKNKN